jgi:hypothetical protein
MTATTEPPVRANPAPKVRLGEELPVFCERCGYSLHGLGQLRCEQCNILHFHCPECGHQQPINTLRPAFQAMLGRVRAFFLVGSVVFRLAFFGLLCIAWAAMGAEWSYQYHYIPIAAPPPVAVAGGAPAQPTYRYEVRTVPLSYEMFLGFGIFGFAYGAVSRMLLLRWRKAPLVGFALAVLVVAAVFVGSWLQYIDRRNADPSILPMPPNLLIGAAFGCGCVMLGASVVWPIWCGLVTVFLPKRAGQALLDWQRSQSNSVSDLARDVPRPMLP